MAYCSDFVLLLSPTMVVSSYLVLELIHLALLVRVGGVFLEDFIMVSLNLKFEAPRFSGYLLNRRSCNLTAPDFLAAGPISNLRGCNCNLTTPDFLAAGPKSKLQGCNCNLSTPDVLAAGPVSKLQGSHCNLTTLDFLAAGLVSKLQGRNCNLTPPVWRQAQ